MHFRQPLGGASRLSDRLGGGFPALVKRGSLSAGSNKVIAGLEPGDLIVAMAGATDGTIPALPASYMSVATALSGTDGMRVGWAIATATSLTATYPVVTQYVVLRGARGAGSVGTVQLAASTTATLPGIAGVKKNSRIITYLLRPVTTAWPAPRTLADLGLVFLDDFAFAAINPTSGGDWPEKTTTYAASSPRVGISVEILA